MDAVMRRAIELATSQRPHPNPAVGAVVLDANGAVVGEGAHAGPGEPHAEVVALAHAGAAAAGGTLVVTLEPCAHHGRTPPCVDAIVAAGIATVIAGPTDPDRQVAGSGFAALTDAGLDVKRGVLKDEVEQADPGYFHHRRTGQPLFRLKVALTLDGQAAARDGSSQWITTEEARRDAHVLRAASDAVLVGAGTVLADDPKLTVRLDDFAGPQPRGVIIAGQRQIPPEAAVFDADPLVYATADIDLPGEVVVVPSGPDGVDITAVSKDLAERGLLSVLVEGGPAVAGSMTKAGLISAITFYYGPLVAAGAGIPAIAGEWSTLPTALPVEIERTTLVGGTLRVDGLVR